MSTNNRPTAARDACHHWCVVDRKDHVEHREEHGSRIESVDLWGSTGLEGHLELRLRRPYVAGIPAAEVLDGHVDVAVISVDGELLRVALPVARSLAAALLRLADLGERNPRA